MRERVRVRAEYLAPPRGGGEARVTLARVAQPRLVRVRARARARARVRVGARGRGRGRVRVRVDTG